VAGRHERTLAEWTRIAPLLPARETRGTYYADHRRVLSGATHGTVVLIRATANRRRTAYNSGQTRG